MSGAPPGQPTPESDETVRIKPQRTYGRPADRPLIPAGGGIPAIFRLIALACVIVIGVAGWFLMRERAAPDQYVGPSADRGHTGIVVRLADEAEILLHRTEGTDVFRFASNRRVVILDFASLREQGLMLNRIAALVEKTGLPRERVLSDEELDAAILASGDTAETYYFGHDYAVADIVRFFALADQGGIGLRPQEEWLRQLLKQEKLFDPQIRAALISIPQPEAGHGMDASMRASILRHELSHAEFFSNPAYFQYVRQFWRDGLDTEGRQVFLRYLAAQGYDPTDEVLMANEMQAYLMHTPDARLFNADILGVPIEVLDRWQASFLLGMPNGWLRDACVSALPSAGTVLRRPRRGSHRGSVSTRMARVLTRTPRRVASDMAA